ncbi:Hypothetical protein LUCI_1476 [Lucifera butyrica]|uniref:Probable GTP-binding protein EngB n=1 Tax=Lucifera butyrica TaxID=1351585 RepID=A0A498R5Z2_9FIRM|nr:ribosome biogenesis GTP-binding protein YihA/YsxC [Lucifera butyrica]VBB06257.1 Hypothetical protein LUCI_1476 [Lucifera butyrica]
MRMTEEKADFTIIQAKYLASAVRPDQYPAGDWQEISFIGRSNVGKSSLINSLCRHHGLARVSGTPGKTQTINFYVLTAKLADEKRLDFLLVDLPGYGYARTGQANRRQWSRFIEEYLLYSPRLRLICQLIDIRHHPMDSDIMVHQWLTENNLPVQIMATKADKLSRSQVKKQSTVIRDVFSQSNSNPIAYSSVQGTGRDELVDAIRKVLLK